MPGLSDFQINTLCLTLQLRLVEAYPVVLAWTAHISIPFPLKLLWCAWGTRPLHSVRQPLEQFEMILEFYWHLFDDVDDGGFHLFFGRHMYKDNSTLSCWNTFGCGFSADEWLCVAPVLPELSRNSLVYRHTTLRAVPEAWGMRIQRCADVQRSRQKTSLFLPFLHLLNRSKTNSTAADLADLFEYE